MAFQQPPPWWVIVAIWCGEPLHSISVHGDKNQKMATWPTCGQTGYIMPVVSGVPNAQRGEANQTWPLGPPVGRMATSHLLPTIERGDKS